MRRFCEFRNFQLATLSVVIFVREFPEIIWQHILWWFLKIVLTLLNFCLATHFAVTFNVFTWQLIFGWFSRILRNFNWQHLLVIFENLSNWVHILSGNTVSCGNWEKMRNLNSNLAIQFINRFWETYESELIFHLATHYWWIFSIFRNSVVFHLTLIISESFSCFLKLHFSHLATHFMVILEFSENAQIFNWQYNFMVNFIKFT